MLFEWQRSATEREKEREKVTKGVDEEHTYTNCVIRCYYAHIFKFRVNTNNNECL